jgi:fatty-acyl-CoA synthase
MPFSDKLDDLRAAADRAVWGIQTVARVGRKLGLHRALTWPGARMVLKELSRGRLSPSLLFRVYAASTPDQQALVQATLPEHKAGHEAFKEASLKRYTYREMNEDIDRVGLALSRQGISRGGAVLLLLKNRVEFFVIQHALNRIGVRVIPASWRATVPEVSYLAQHSGAKAIFFDADIAGMIREMSPKLPDISTDHMFSVGGFVSGFPSLAELIANVHGAAPDWSQESTIVMYTSGTTGKPKGAVRSFAERQALPGTLAFLGETPCRVGERHLVACPIYHITGLGFATFAFVLRGTVVMMADFKPELFLEMVQRYRVTSTTIVPTMLHRIVELGPDKIHSYDLSSLKAIFSAGAPLSGPLAIEAMDLLGDKVWNLYGATETSMVTVATPADLRASPGTVGRPVPGVDIRLINERGQDCKIGEVGELYARTRLQVSGYHEDPEATRQSMLDGYFSVGDLARVDARGCYHIEGRKRDMIISGGMNVYPAEVEAVLHEHPSVAEAAIVGAPDREWGERVRAFVVRRSGAEVDGEALKAHCRARLAGPKVPREYIFLDSLPHNPTGKVLKRELARMR